MPTFLARALLLLAAAFSLRILGRRLDQDAREQGKAWTPTASKNGCSVDAGAARAGRSATSPDQPGRQTGTGLRAADRDPAASGKGGLPHDGAGNIAAIAPAFASYGGSGVVAGVVVEPETSQPSSDSMSDISLAAPDERGRTPSAAERASLAEDPLAAKHDSAALDFKTVDYGNAKAAERMVATASSRSDGWTVPHEAEVTGHAVPEESLAAFKSVGGAGAVHGAPDSDGPAAPSARDASETSAERVEDVHVQDGPGATVRSAPETDERALAPDDLTRIDGIGPSIERLLFDNGVYRFADIAAWTPAEVVWADALTGFPGRVDRENWVEQARRIAAPEQPG